MVGPRFRRKFCQYICACILVVMLIWSLPTIFGNLVTKIIA